MNKDFLQAIIDSLSDNNITLDELITELKTYQITQNKVPTIAHKTEDCRHWSPKEALIDAIEEVDTFKPNKCITLLIKKVDGGEFQYRYIRSNIFDFELISSLEVFKSDIIDAIKQRF